MTDITFTSLAVLFLSGIAVGVVIDCIRVQKDRLPFAYAKYWRLLLEVVAWVGCGVLTFYLLYEWQDGKWRAVHFIAQLAGIIAYDQFLFRIIRLIGNIFVYIIIRPILFSFSVLWKTVLLFIQFIWKILNKFILRHIR